MRARVRGICLRGRGLLRSEAVAKSAGIVLELQRDCLEQATPVSLILRKAKVIASKLDLEELKVWIDAELNGYDCSLNDLPDHRKGIGQPKFKNPYHGWLPIATDGSRFGEMIRTVWLRQSASEIESLVSENPSDTLIMYYSPQIEQLLWKSLPVPMECGLHFSKSEAIFALDFIRNKMLDWTLELEQRNIIGEGLSFGDSQKVEAKMVTNHIYGGNIGVLGNVAGDTNNSHFVNSSGIDVTKIRDFLDQVIPASAGLDPSTRSKVVPLLEDLHSEVNGEKEAGKLTTIFNSLRTVLEGASGNLVASAILTLLTAQFG